MLVSCWAPVMLLELYNYCSNWLWVHSEKSVPEYYLLPRSLMALISEIQWLLITVMITVSCMARRKTTHLPFTWGAKRRETRDRDRVSMRVKKQNLSEVAAATVTRSRQIELLRMPHAHTHTHIESHPSNHQESWQPIHAHTDTKEEATTAYGWAVFAQLLAWGLSL